LDYLANILGPKGGGLTDEQGRGSTKTARDNQVINTAANIGNQIAPAYSTSDKIAAAEIGKTVNNAITNANIGTVKGGGLTTEQASGRKDSFSDLFGKVGTASSGVLYDMLNPVVTKVESAAKIADVRAAATPTTDWKKLRTQDDSKSPDDFESKPSTNAATAEAAKSTVKDMTMKDLNDQLVLLNRHMVTLIKYSENTANYTHKTVDAISSVSGKRT
jgi:hypothetical protein